MLSLIVAMHTCTTKSLRSQIALIMHNDVSYCCLLRTECCSTWPHISKLYVVKIFWCCSTRLLISTASAQFVLSFVASSFPLLKLCDLLISETIAAAMNRAITVATWMQLLDDRQKLMKDREIKLKALADVELQLARKNAKIREVKFYLDVKGYYGCKKYHTAKKYYQASKDKKKQMRAFNAVSVADFLKKDRNSL
jgi:hypothetical protein